MLSRSLSRMMSSRPSSTKYIYQIDVSVPSFLQKIGHAHREVDFTNKFNPKHFRLIVKKGKTSTRASVHEGPALQEVITQGTTLELLEEAFNVEPPLLNF